MTRMQRRHFLLGTGALGLAACSAPERDLLDGFEDVDIPLEPAPPTLPGEIDAIPDDATSLGGDRTEMDALADSVPIEDRPGLSFVARAPAGADEIPVFAKPGDPEPTWTFANPLESGGDLVFLVDDFDGVDYYRVLLPVRPNGSFGWVRVDSVDLLRHNFSILVDLEAFRMVVTEREQVILDATVGVARDNAPTPLGRYYTTEIVRPPEPDTVYGAFAYGLSGFSDTFVTFNGGPGQLGIHGTNDPSTIGTNVSAGCIRMLDEDITAMVEVLQVTAGVPVEVI
ncbi:MAG: L,D-transpeptidase [Actinomycetota bacterium]